MAILFILAGGKVAKRLKVHHDEPKASDKVVLIEDTFFSAFFIIVITVLFVNYFQVTILPWLEFFISSY